MRYYVTADPHGFFSIMRAQLAKAGYFKDEEPHKLIICGDALDRGSEAIKMQNFLLREMDAGRLILVRGNHEDLFCNLAGKDRGLPYRHHVHNGTYQTALQLTKWDQLMAEFRNDEFAEEIQKTPFYKTIIPASVDFFETAHYIFLHGWAPCRKLNDSDYELPPDWRKASREDWVAARWVNGMDAWVTAPLEKTAVVGHWDVCYGHNRFEHHGGLRSEKPDFTPFTGDGIIALDACTVLSRMVNVIVLED